MRNGHTDGHTENDVIPPMLRTLTMTVMQKDDDYRRRYDDDESGGPLKAQTQKEKGTINNCSNDKDCSNNCNSTIAVTWGNHHSIILLK